MALDDDLLNEAPDTQLDTPAEPPAEPSLRDTLDAAIEQHDTPPADETPEQREERLRDEKGRFAKKPDEQTPEERAEAQAKGEAQRKAEKPQVPTEAKPIEGFKPPRSWKAEAAAEWAKLPPKVQEEVLRRESDVQRVMQEHAQARSTLEQFGGILQPYVANIQATGLPPAELVKQFFQADHELRHGNTRHKATVVANIIKTYGVDISQLDEVLSTGDIGKPDPTADLRRQIAQELRQELSPVMTAFQAMQQQQAAAAQRIEAEAAAEIEAIAAKPYFDELRQDMADIMEMATRRGVALNLEQAYDKAARLHPQISERLAAQSAAERAKTATRAAHRARSAAVSVGGGAPAGHGAPASRGGNSIREALEAAMASSQDNV